MASRTWSKKLGPNTHTFNMSPFGMLYSDTGQDSVPMGTLLRDTRPRKSCARIKIAGGSLSEAR